MSDKLAKILKRRDFKDSRPAIEFIAAQPDANAIEIDQIIEFFPDRRSAVAFLKKLEKESFGRVTVGRHNSKTRFSRAKALWPSSGDSAAAVHDEHSGEVKSAAKSSHAVGARPKTLPHQLHLRSDFKVVFELPADLNQSELEKLIKFLELLPVSDPAHE